jgi:hypothetical protein
MRLSRKLWKKRGYLTLPREGKQAKWSRAESYRRAKDGTMPTESDGKFLWVPQQLWAKRLEELLGRS